MEPSVLWKAQGDNFRIVSNTRSKFGPFSTCVSVESLTLCGSICRTASHCCLDVCDNDQYCAHNVSEGTILLSLPKIDIIKLNLLGALDIADVCPPFSLSPTETEYVL